VTVKLYELAGAEDARLFSPYCWRIRLALEHKGLSFTSLPWRFTEKDRIAATGQGKVPVLEHDGRTLWDSWTIAVHLEETWPERPSLFGDAGGRAFGRFVADWADTVLHPALIRLLLTDIHAVIAAKDRAYFRQSREERFGMSLEQVTAGREARIEPFRQLLAPLRAGLARQPFLCGESPAFADYAVAGTFHWARAVSPLVLLADDDPVAAWRERLLARLSPASRSLTRFY
jgi:glutathione S-transferase